MEFFVDSVPQYYFNDEYQTICRSCANSDNDLVGDIIDVSYEKEETDIHCDICCKKIF